MIETIISIGHSLLENTLFLFNRRGRERTKRRYSTNFNDFYLKQAQQLRLKNDLAGFYRLNRPFKLKNFTITGKKEKGGVEIESWEYRPDFYYFPDKYKGNGFKRSRINHIIVTKKQGSKPSVALILMDAWGMDNVKSDLKLAKRLARDYDIATFRTTLPFHRERSPESYESGELALNGDASISLRGFKQAVEEALVLRSYLRKHLRYKVIGIGGLSLGGIASAVAAFLVEFDFNLQIYTAGFLPEIVWKAKRLEFIKRSFEDQGIDKGMLREYWAVIDPVSFSASAQTKNLKIIIGKYDSVIKPKCATEYYQLLQRNNRLQIEFEMRRRSHYTGILFAQELAHSVGDYIEKIAKKRTEKKTEDLLCHTVGEATRESMNY